VGFEDFPLIIGWELTLRCNLRCQHCGSSAASARVNELTLEESLSICDQLPALLVQEVDFTGGEPLLRPDWTKIASHLTKLGVSTKILTNGLTLGPDTIARMKDAGVSGAGVSLDGLETNHDNLRCHKGLFRQAVSGIELALSANLAVVIITTVNAQNINELPSLFEFLLSIGICQWQIQPIFPFGRSLLAEDLLLTEQAYMQLGDFFRVCGAKSNAAGLQILPGDSFGYFTELDTRDPAWRGCPAGLYSCGITSDGKIKGCLSLPDEIIEGDLRHDDLWDIWFHPASFSYTRHFVGNQLGPSCHDCVKALQCQGGCSAMSYGNTRKFHNDPFCFYGIKNRSAVPKRV
jgi:radical SAM protein with 4Fe4S-binding SPASM domain